MANSRDRTSFACIDRSAGDSDMPDEKKILPYGLKDTKEASQPDQHKLSAFQVAPTRKTAFERAREQAQQKAEREAEETAAAYESFVAEYGTGEDPNVPPSGRTQRQRQEQDERFQRHQRSARPASQYASFDDVDSEEEERERKRMKLKSGASYLNELKNINQKRERYDPRPTPTFTERGREPSRRTQTQTQSVQEPPRAIVPTIRETAPDEKSSDEIDFYRSKPPTMPSNLALSTRSKARLTFLLNNITAERFAIAGVTAFAMTHSSCVDEIAKTIGASITEYAEDWKTTIARLWCISDILHNSWLPIPNVWKYRSAFESQLVGIFKHLKSVADSIDSRIRRENFRRLVTSVLDVWDSWICFGDGVVETFYAAFDDKPVEQVKVVAVKPEKKSGGWKKLGEPAQAVVEAKETPGGEPEANLDGEAIDLDGEEIDLDGEAINLDGPVEATAPPHISQPEEPVSTTSGTTTAPNTSKIKMSFGKFKLPSRAAPQQPGVKSDTTINTTTHTGEAETTETSRPPEVARRARPSAADFM